MQRKIKKCLYGIVICVSMAMASTAAMATGMQPETSVVILYEAEGETSINVRNTDDAPALLYTTIENIPEDQEPLVVLTPPVARVEAGETQLVRFLRQGGQASETQRLKRVIFEGIPQRPQAGTTATVSFTVRQNLPLIVHPKGLARNREPWKLLEWRVEGGQLLVVNEHPYVVRLAPEVTLQPSGRVVALPRAYVLPGETLSVPADAQAGVSSVTILPATVYGYSVGRFDAPVSASGR